MENPETDYAVTSDGVYLAYQTLGTGPPDSSGSQTGPGNIDFEWDEFEGVSFLRDWAGFSRVITHDQRGSDFRAGTFRSPTSRLGSPTSGSCSTPRARSLVAFAGSRLDVPNISKFTEQVWIVRPDGTGLQPVTSGDSNWTVAGWSPDGRQLILGRLDQQLRDDGLAVVSVDGTGLSVIQPSALSSWAVWRP